MRRAALLVLGLAGCAAPHTAGPAGFDAAEWLRRARPSAVEYVDGTAPDEPLRAATRARAAELDAAVGWDRACDTHWDPEAATEVYDPLGPDPLTDSRGVYSVHAVEPGESVVAVTCSRAAYQSASVLVHVVGRQAALLRGARVDVRGDPHGPPSAVYTSPGVEGGGRLFETFNKSRGFGDCGVLSRYRIGRLGTADLVEVRARACDVGPEDLPPDAWPVVYPRR